MRVAAISLRGDVVEDRRGELTGTPATWAKGDWVRVKLDGVTDPQWMHRAFVYPEESAEMILKTYNEYVTTIRAARDKLVQAQARFPHI